VLTVKGSLDAKASTATGYAWIVLEKEREDQPEADLSNALPEAAHPGDTRVKSVRVTATYSHVPRMRSRITHHTICI